MYQYMLTHIFEQFKRIEEEYYGGKPRKQELIITAKLIEGLIEYDFIL